MSIWERGWKMNVGKRGLDKAEFTLVKNQVDGITYYTMKLDKIGEEEADTWTNCRLVQRGLQPTPWGQPELAPFVAGSDYGPEIDTWLKRVSAATLRLEGEISVFTQPALSPNPVTALSVAPITVTMYVVKNAVKVAANKFRDLLLVRLHSTLGGEVLVSSPDGTNHGDPTNP